VHCGYTEETLHNTSYLFYKDLVCEIGLLLNYNSVTHLLGRDYADADVSKYVDSCNPIHIDFNKPQTSTGIKNVTHEKVTMNTLKNFGLIK